MRQTRRETVRAIAAGAVLGTVGTTTATAGSGFTAVSSPTSNTLYDVAQTAVNQFAGGSGGVLLERQSGSWTTVLGAGISGNGNAIRGADTTDDGERLWLVGGSGRIGEYDVRTGDLNDFSAPNDVTNNFNDVAVTGQEGSANVFIAGDSGKIYFSTDNGATFGSTTPGSGSEVNAIDFFDTTAGHAVDGNKSVFETDDGKTYQKIGIENANVNFYGVDSDGDGDVWIAGGNGVLYNYDGSSFVTYDVGNPSLRDVEIDSTDTGVTVGSGGAAFEYDGTGFTSVTTPVGNNLKSVVLGDVETAVGASGTIIER